MEQRHQDTYTTEAFATHERNVRSGGVEGGSTSNASSQSDQPLTHPFDLPPLSHPLGYTANPSFRTSNNARSLSHTHTH